MKATLRQVRQHWNALVDRVNKGERIIVTKHGAPRVAIVPLEDLEILRKYWPEKLTS